MTTTSTCKLYPQDRAQAKQLYKELEDTVSHIKILLSHLQVIISQNSDMANEHRENLQLLILTSSMSEKLLIQLTEKEDEVHALREQNNKRMQQMKQLEDEKQDQREQAKQFEIDYRVEFEENELLRAENDTLKHQLDSGLECLVDEGDDITGDTGDPKRVISGLKARVKDLNEDVNKLRDHSKQQSRQILKYKQQVEVSEVSSYLAIMHLSMQSPTPPPIRGRVGICHRGVAKDAPPGPKFLDNPPLTPYYSPGVYTGKAANNVKLPL